MSLWKSEMHEAMMSNEIHDELYSVHYDQESGTVTFGGTLRLGGSAEYAPIVALMEKALDGHSSILLDLTRLEFLNSSGIATLSRFVIACRSRKSKHLTIRGSKVIAWHSRSLVNLHRLMPDMTLEFA